MSLSRRTMNSFRQMARIVANELRRTQRVIVTPESRPQVESPIFVIGVHRSGTTLVRLILDSHSRIACPPESFFLLPLGRVLEDPKAMEGFEAMGFARETVHEKLRELGAYFFETYAGARGKQRWADKTPSYVDCLDLLEALYGPRCQYLFVYRHGMDAATSIARTEIPEAAAHVQACGGDAHAGAARYWATQCRKMRAFQRAHEKRCLEVRYEALVSDPEPRLREIFEFLGEPWEPAVLQFHAQPHDRWIGLEDRKAASSKGFAPNIGAHRALAPDVQRRMAAEAGPMLAELGYETAQAP